MWPKRQRRRVLAAYRQRRGEQLPGPEAGLLEPARTVRAARARPSPARAPLAAWRRSPARLASGGLAALCLLALLHLAWSDRYVVHGATVHGNRRVPAETLYALGGLEGRRAFGLDPAAVARRIETLEDVQSASVGLALPNRAWIRVVETQLVLHWQAPGAAWAIDETGRALPLPEPAEGLIRVDDPAGIIRGAGDRLPLDLVAAALAFGRRFGALGYRSEIGFTALSPEGWLLHLGPDADRMEAQAATLDALRPRLASAGRPVELIDLRFGAGSYYRLKGDMP